jgi:hypothetical protein
MGLRLFRHANDAGSQAALTEGHHGGLLATMLSGVALLFSGLSYYESALKAAVLEVYVPPVIQYGRDGGTEVFAVPITVANNGSNTGTVLVMELAIENPSAEGEAVKSKTFYSAFFGEHPKNPDAAQKAFGPIAVPGRATYTETVRFYPQGEEAAIIQDRGDFRLTLKMQVAGQSAPAPLVFTRRLPYLSEQHLTFRRGTIMMHAPDWKPAAGAGLPAADKVE